MPRHLTTHQRDHAAAVASGLDAARLWNVTRSDGLMIRQGGGWTAVDAEAERFGRKDAEAIARKLRQAGRPIFREANQARATAVRS